MLYNKVMRNLIQLHAKILNKLFIEVWFSNFLNFMMIWREKDPRIADIFVKKGPFLKLYTNYIREFNSMVALLDDTRKKNPDFDHAVTNFEVSKFLTYFCAQYLWV